MNYEQKVQDELIAWKMKMRRRTGMINKISKKTQTKINSYIPDKIHQVVTEGIKGMVKATLTGSNLTTNKKPDEGLSLYERDVLVRQKLSSYRRSAVIEGAGTGAGGFLLGLADFPLLLSIKMKFLFEAAVIYGYDTNQYEERLYMLHIFQLAFSSDDKRKDVFQIIEHWEEYKQQVVDMDWREFQQEYRDYIDLVKMFQLIPGIGAVVGAFANYNLLDQLGETAMNVYRMRFLEE